MTTTEDKIYMQRALRLAEQGVGFTHPNPMVGAVVVKDGRIVGEGFHQRLGGPHAEVNALNAAGEQAVGAALYVTLEPCNHAGRTPPCTERILASGVSRVIMAMEDPNPRVRGGGAQRLKQAGVEVVSGVCRKEAEKLNEAFIHYAGAGKPFVVAKCAATLDGRIATRTGHSRWVTGPESRAFAHRLRHAVDGIVVGIGTVTADDPSLTTRIEGFPGRDPARIVLDTRLRISENARVLRLDSEAETYIICGTCAPKDRIERLSDLGARIIPLATGTGGVDWSELLIALGGLSLTSIMIEGGARVLGGAFRAGIVNKSFFFYAPKLLGGDDGTPVCSGPGAETMDRCVHLDEVQIRRFGNDVMIAGYPRLPADHQPG